MNRSRRLRTSAPFAAGGALGLVLVVVAFELQTILPSRTSSDALGVRVVAALRQIRSIRSDLRIPTRPALHALCVSDGTSDTVYLSDGQRLSVTKTNVSVLRGRSHATRLVNAEARLAACPGLIAAELSRRLVAGKGVLIRTTFACQPAYWLRVDSEPPKLIMIVSKVGLRPLAIQYGSRRLIGESLLSGIELIRLSRNGDDRHDAVFRIANDGVNPASIWVPDLDWTISKRRRSGKKGLNLHPARMAPHRTSPAVDRIRFPSCAVHADR